MGNIWSFSRNEKRVKNYKTDYITLYNWGEGGGGVNNISNNTTAAIIHTICSSDTQAHIGIQGYFIIKKKLLNSLTGIIIFLNI